MQRLPKRSKVVTLFQYVLWRPSLIFWGIKNNIENKSFQICRLEEFLLSERELPFHSFRSLFFKEVEYHLPDKYFQSDYKFKYLFHQDTFKRLLMYFETEKLNNFKSRPKWKFIISSYKICKACPTKNTFFFRILYRLW